ncbi:MAG: RsmE family RNA methyltransferase [Armatimonadota bacterium]
MTRVFLDRDQISDDTATVTGSDAHHLLNVLRMGPGDTFIVVDEQGAERMAQIVEADQERLVAELGAPRQAPVEPSVGLTLYHGLPRASRYETALRMCTEVGVSEFVPVLCEKSVVRLSGRAVEKKRERWQRIVEEAAKQCGRTQIPGVAPPTPWQEALEHFVQSEAPGVMPSAGLAGSDSPSLGERVEELGGGRSLALFIGPESGFSLAEEAEARDLGVLLVTMGPRILRTETAAVVASALCLERMGELA